jgi:pimeloyl-ACP methyl ester carboxylesterase
MPAPADYNGMLVIWAHGFQDAGTPVEIPEDQLCIGDFLHSRKSSTRWASGSLRTATARQGWRFSRARTMFSISSVSTRRRKAQPSKVYLVGASEGGLITALSVEQHPDVYSAGLAACGPIGNFPMQINYFGDARATFKRLLSGPDSRSGVRESAGGPSWRSGTTTSN